MEIDFNRIGALVDRPTEGLNIELKGWLDPSTKEAQAKIVKACIALRNRDGGYLLVGFDDKTLAPDAINSPPPDVRAAYRLDDIQGLISKYSHPLFEISVVFEDRATGTFPVIVIPSGVTVPTSVKLGLLDSGGAPLLKVGEVFCRTLLTSGRVSSASPRPGDWEDIVQACFDNRDAVFGRFIRRHMAPSDVASIAAAIVTAAQGAAAIVPSSSDRAKGLLDE